jgi:uncharacterized protein
MLKTLLLASACAVALHSSVWAQANATATAATAAGASPAKKELVGRILKLQQGGVEQLARGMAERPAAQLMQQAAMALQTMPTEKREATARDIEADVRKFAEDTVPALQSRAVKLAPSTIGAMMEERFTEEELREVLAFLESPTNRKFQGMAADMQRALSEKLLAESRADIEPKLRKLEQTMATRLGVTTRAPAGSGADAGAPKAAPKK